MPEVPQTGTFAAFGEPNFRRYFWGQGVSLVGTWMQSVAQSWLVLRLSHSGTVLGLVVAAQTLPVLFLGPYGGVIADRVNKRRLLFVTQTTLGLLALTLGILTVTNTVRLWMVLVLAGVFGIVNACENPARQSFVPEMVGSERLRSAVTMNSVLVNGARAVGPAIAGSLIATVGIGVCFLANAGSYIAVLIALSRMDLAALHATKPVERKRGQLREGFRYVKGAPGLLVPLIMMAIIGTLAYEFQVSLPLLARDSFAGGAGVFALLTSAQGIGAVAGGLVVARYGKTGVRPVTVNAAALGVAMTMAAAAPSLAFEVVALVLVGATGIAFLSTGNSTLQLTSDPQFRGRVMALWAVAFLGSTPIGGPIVGFVSEHATPRYGLGLGAASCFLAALLGTMLIERSRKLPEK